MAQTQTSPAATNALDKTNMPAAPIVAMDSWLRLRLKAAAPPPERSG